MGEGHRKVIDAASGLSWHPCFPQAAATGDAARRTCARPIAAAAVAEIAGRSGEIITHAGNLMRRTKGVRVFTVDDGWTKIFTAIEPLERRVRRTGMCASVATASPHFSRSPWGLRGCYASTSAGATRGLALRTDHGSQYLSDDFINWIKFWDNQRSLACRGRTAPDQRRRREIRSRR